MENINRISVIGGSGTGKTTLTSNLDGGCSLKQRILNLFGHTHSKEKFYQDNPTMYNVALDAHNNTPVSIDQIIEDIKAKRDECEKLL